MVIPSILVILGLSACGCVFRYCNAVEKGQNCRSYAGSQCSTTIHNSSSPFQTGITGGKRDLGD